MRRVLLSVALLMLFAPTLYADPPVIGGCEVFPADNPWNTDISDAPVHPKSATYIANILANGGSNVHPDFGEHPDYGIPWTTVDDSQPLVPVEFDYDDESDPGPYPIPPDAPIEGGEDSDGDRHVLVIETTNCILYEMFYAHYSGSDVTGWTAGSGAVWDLSSNDIRPEKWTSADAAGLPILPGLAKCDEAESGAINHALRFTVRRTQKAFIYPATHYASSITDTDYPPMGLRLRLKANYDISHLDGQALAVAQALKTYGMILADNGSNWFISGETNPGCWDDDDLNRLKAIPGTAFEVIVSPPPPSDVPGDLLLNGDFEGGDVGGKIPMYWKVTGTKDKRVCNKESAIGGVYKTFAYNDRCAFQFKGTGTNDKIKQTVTFDTPMSAGGEVDIAAWVETINAVGGAGQIKAKLIYDDGSKTSAAAPLDGGTSNYVPVNLSISDTDGLKKVKLKMIYAGASGKVLIDSMSMVAGAARALLVPPPPAP